MELNVNRVLFACIVFLEGLVIGITMSKLALVAWSGRWRQLARTKWLQQGRALAKKFQGDPRADEKFQCLQCKLVVTGSWAFLLALFPRMAAVQGALWRDEEHSIFPSMDISTVISAFVCVITLRWENFIGPKVLNLWFLIMNFTSLLPLFLADPEDVRMVSYVVILPAFMIGLCAKHNVLVIISSIVSGTVTAQQMAEPTTTDLISVIAMTMLSMSAMLGLRYQMYENVRVGLRLKHRTIDLEAVSALLLGFCDAVVETDDALQLTDNARQLSTLLLQGQGGRDLAGRDILSFFYQEDRDRIRHSFSTSTSQTTALNARMLDALGNMVRVELLHVQFSNLDGQRHHLVGMREFQDVASAVPFMEDDYDPEQALLEVLRKAESSLVFDATSFEVLSVSKGFQGLSGSNSLEGLNLFEVADATGPQSFSCRMQDAVNAIDDAASCQQIMLLRQVELYGEELDVAVMFQHDKILQSLVGNVVVLDAVLQAEVLRAQGLASHQLRKMAMNSPGTSRSAVKMRTSASL